jgi:hypothetical protein
VRTTVPAGRPASRNTLLISSLGETFTRYSGLSSETTWWLAAVPRSAPIS